MMPSNRKRRALFRRRSLDRANAALASIGRFRTGRSDIHSLHNKIGKAMGHMPHSHGQPVFRKQGRGA